MAERIAGIALMPRESRNGIYYDTEELKKFEGVVVPLRVEHGGPESNIGQVKFTYDEDKQQVKYEAIVEDKEWQDILDNVQFQVSIGASVLEQRELCDEQRKKCLNAPVLKEILELSVVRTPGVPESTLNVIENKNVLFEKIITEQDMPSSFNGLLDAIRIKEEIATSIRNSNPDLEPEEVDRKAIEMLGQLERSFMTLIQTPQVVSPVPEQPSPTGAVEVPNVSDNTSNIQTPQSSTMTTKESTPKVEEKVKVTIETDGDIEVANKDTKKEEAPVEVPAKEVPAVEAPKTDVSEKVAERIEKSNSETIKAVIQTVKEAWKPKSQVEETADPEGFVEEQFTDESAKEFLDKVFENGYGKMVIDKEGWIASHTGQGRTTGNGEVTEAVGTSGTIPGINLQKNVNIQVGSKTVTSIRQFGQFQAIPTGQNTARFYRITNPDAGAITESPTTDITATTHTLTSIDVTCAIRGWRQTVEKAELEDFPSGFLNALRETARLESIRDEHRIIVQDLASTARDFGGVTTAPYHIDAADGSAVATPTDEDAAGEFDEDALSFSKRYLTELGQDTSPSKLIAFISPRAFETLSTASTLSEYTQIGNPTVTRLGELEKLYGIDIIVTNELLVANNAYRNLVCVKGKAWALASQRSMELEMQKQIAGQYWDIVWTHRIGVNVLDPNTYVIASSIES